MVPSYSWKLSENSMSWILQYMAPEVSQPARFGSLLGYSHTVDFWCLAVLLHILLTGRYPYPNAEARDHNDLVSEVWLICYDGSYQIEMTRLRELRKRIKHECVCFLWTHSNAVPLIYLVIWILKFSDIYFLLEILQKEATKKPMNPNHLKAKQVH